MYEFGAAFTTNEKQKPRLYGAGLWWFATSFLLLRELRHLKLSENAAFAFLLIDFL
jgi:hypothetical protein